MLYLSFVWSYYKSMLQSFEYMKNMRKLLVENVLVKYIVTIVTHNKVYRSEWF